MAYKIDFWHECRFKKYVSIYIKKYLQLRHTKQTHHCKINTFFNFSYHSEYKSIIYFNKTCTNCAGEYLVFILGGGAKIRPWPKCVGI